MFCENVVTLIGWMCKNYSNFGLFNMYYSSLFYFLIIDLCSFFLYIKRVNRLMNSIMNSIFGLVTCHFLPFTLGLLSYLQWWHNSEVWLQQDRVLIVRGRILPRSMASSDEYRTLPSWYWLPSPSVIALWLDLASSDGYASSDGPQAQRPWH